MMGASVVPHLHIDMLVKVAVEGPSGNPFVRQSFPLTYATPDGRRLASRSERQAAAGVVQPSELGALWFVENTRSVMCRYPSTVDGGTLPGKGDEWAQAYRYRDPIYRMTCVETLKAIRCLEYQSCEHPEWEASAAKHALDRLRSATIEYLPGFSDAPWEWTKSDLRSRGAGR